MPVFVISLVALVLFVTTLTLSTKLLMDWLQQEVARLHDQIRELTKQNRTLTANLVARNDREFQVLYGNAQPQDTQNVVFEMPEYDDYEDATTLIDLKEEALLFGLTETPVG